MKGECEWEPQGNGYYYSECGELYKDKGRFIAMRRKYYRSIETQIPFINVCPNCKKTVFVYGEREKYNDRQQPPKQRKCPDCSGSGIDMPTQGDYFTGRCSRCKGEGTIPIINIKE